MTTKLPTISLCMIVKDEQDWISQCIRSVKPILYETIVVDTGSTDDTPHIAEDLGATVLFQPWQDDFSEPRNLSLTRATGEWILVLDADEAIAERDLRELHLLTLDRKQCYQFTQRHYSNDPRISDYVPCRGEYPEWERTFPGYFASSLCRLFPNDDGIHYQGRIHELVEHSIHQMRKHTIIKSRIPIHHYGHSPEVRAKKDKSTLYTPLGQRKVAEQPATWKAHFELGVEHNCSGRKVESVACFRAALALEPSYVPAWTNLGYVLCELGQYDEAVEALNSALALDHKSPEAHCNLGVTYMRTARWIFAEAHLKRAIELKPDYVNAFCNLGQTYLSLGMAREAISAFQTIVEQLPNSAAAYADLGVALIAGKEFTEANEALSKAQELDPTLSRTLYYKSRLHIACGRVVEAAEAIDQFCGLEEHARPDSSTSDPFLIQLRNESELLRKGLITGNRP